MVGRNANIYFREEIYNKLRQIAGAKISPFVNEAVQEKLAQVQQQQKEELRQKLRVGYQKRVQNKDLQKMLQVYGEMSWEDISTKLTGQEKKHGKKN